MPRKKRGRGRPRKSPNTTLARKKGVYAKDGMLYTAVWKDPVTGEKVPGGGWEKTGLPDTPENWEKAERIRNERLAKMEKKSIPPKNNNKEDILFLDYVESFRLFKNNSWSEGSIDKNRHAYNRLIPFFNGKKLCEIDKYILSDYFNKYLIEEKHYAEDTINDTKILVNQALEEALDEGLIEKNPLRRVSLNRTKIWEYVKIKHDDDVIFDEEEAALFLQTAKDYLYRTHNEILYYAFYFTLFLGLRRSELMGLRWSDIDFDKKKLYIYRVRTKGISQPTIVRNGTKNGDPMRIYYLEEYESQMLKSLKDQEDEIRWIIGWGKPIQTSRYEDNDVIFKHKDGKEFHPDTLTDIFKDIVESNPNLPQDITLHGLRKTCASILISNGVDIKSVQDRLGHKDSEVLLDIYAKVKSKAAKEKTSGVMSKILNGYGIGYKNNQQET